jgi:DNA-binding transcriptional MerR regulator
MKGKMSSILFKIFELSQVAEIVGVSTATAKNWVNDRIFQIKPSIREADGKGSRSLFSEKDIYKFFFVNEATKLGLRNKIIKELLPLVDAELEKSDNPWLIIRHTGGEWNVALREGRSPMFALPLEHTEFALVLDLSVISGKIDEKASKIQGKKTEE